MLEGDIQVQGNYQAEGDTVSHFVGLDLGQSAEHTAALAVVEDVPQQTP